MTKTEYTKRLEKLIRELNNSLIYTRNMEALENKLKDRKV
jgi:hypothetical protein